MRVTQVPTDVIQQYQPRMSRVVWRPAPGRKMGFVLTHANDVLGLMFFSSPVISMAARDKAIGMPKDGSERGAALRSWYDLSVCVSAQPIGWYWNVGKCLAMIAPTLGPFLVARYGGTFSGVVTTGAFGRASQYERVMKFVGYSSGFGHEHINSDQYADIVAATYLSGSEVPTGAFGEGPNLRFRRIAAYRKATNDKTHTTFHGNKRSIYFVRATDKSWQDAISEWYKRWGKPRWDRVQNETPPYLSGISHD